MCADHCGWPGLGPQQVPERLGRAPWSCPTEAWKLIILPTLLPRQLEFGERSGTRRIRSGTEAGSQGHLRGGQSTCPHFSESHCEMGQRALGPLSNRKCQALEVWCPALREGSVQTALVVQGYCGAVCTTCTHLSQRDSHFAGQDTSRRRTRLKNALDQKIKAPFLSLF